MSKSILWFYIIVAIVVVVIAVVLVDFLLQHWQGILLLVLAGVTVVGVGLYYLAGWVRRL